MKQMLVAFGRGVKSFAKRHTSKIVVGSTLVVSGASAMAEGEAGFDPVSGITSAITSAGTVFTGVATLSVTALTFYLITRFLRKGAK